MKISLKMRIFALILAAATPFDSKTRNSTNIRSFSVKFWQRFRLKEKKPLKVKSRKSVVFWRRYDRSCQRGRNWCRKRTYLPLPDDVSQWILCLCPKNFGRASALKRRSPTNWNHRNRSDIDGDTADLVAMVGTKKEVIDLFAESTSISKMRTIPACWPIEVCDLFADLFQGSENEKVFDLFAELTSIPKSPINQTKKRRCASLRRQRVYNRQAVWSPKDRSIDSTEWLNKGDDDRRVCRTPPLNNELFALSQSTAASICCFVSFWYSKTRRNRVGDFLVFLVLKHA